MKRTLLLALGVFAILSTQAQQQAGITPKPNMPLVSAKMMPNKIAKVTNKPALNEFFLPVREGNPYTVSAASLSNSTIGYTQYDLQTNSSIQNRIKHHGNGVISAIWTYGRTPNAFNERGMAYQYKDSYSAEWLNLPAYEDITNITRIENIRTGFGSIDRIGGKGDVVLAHNLNGVMQLTTNNSVGSQGTFASSTVAVLDSMFWPRMAVGGSDNKSLHLISITTPTASNSGGPVGTKYKGIDGCLLYSRSTNGGQTWDKQKVLLPGIDSVQYKRFGGDGYAIDARDTVVAFTTGELASDWFLMKSTDNGETFTKKQIKAFPIPNYDYTTAISDTNNDGQGDTIDSSDGSLAIVIDNNNVVHVFSGKGTILDDTIPAYSFFTTANGIYYWNDTMTTGPIIIAEAPDLNGDGFFGVSGDPNFPFTPANYGSGLASYPSAGVDANNNLYVTFAGAIEQNGDASNVFFGGPNSDRVINYRHIFAVKKVVGQNWTAPNDLTPFDQLTEYMYASLARDVDDSIRIVYQEDATPGCAVNTDNATNPDYSHDFTDNQIKYLAISVNDITTTSIKEVGASNFDGVNVFPNPANNSTQLTFTLKKQANINASIVNLLGQKVSSVNGGNMGAGSHNVQLNISNLAPGLYFVNLQTGNETITKKLVVK